MEMRFAMGVELEQPKDLEKIYLEGPIIISYTLAGNDPEARLYVRQGSSRMPLYGTDRDIAAMFSIDSDDLNDVFEHLGEPSIDELLTEFQSQGRNRRSIERTLEGPYFVRTSFDPDRGAASATEYKAVAPTEAERVAYARVRDDLLSKMDAVQARIQIASSTTLDKIKRQASDSNQKYKELYKEFLPLVEAERAAILQTAERIMRIRSDFKRAHDKGYVCLQRYQKQQENLYLALTGWAEPLLTAMNDATRSLYDSVFHSTSLDREHLSTGAVLASQAHELAKSLYKGVYGEEKRFSQDIRILAGNVHFAQHFILQADNIQRGMDTLEKQRRRFAKARGPSMVQEKRKARKLVADCIERIETNRGILTDLDLKGNSWGLDKIKALLLMKMEQFRHQAEGLQREYEL
ncbi:MAG TPA: hypothetical protein VJI15_06580 [Candidatus Nanoarchaeia archaeon]|nr:hypothetical protein [Candidatus Nanoarchaeia archaeon]